MTSEQPTTAVDPDGVSGGDSAGSPLQRPPIFWAIIALVVVFSVGSGVMYAKQQHDNGKLIARLDAVQQCSLAYNKVNAENTRRRADANLARTEAQDNLISAFATMQRTDDPVQQEVQRQDSARLFQEYIVQSQAAKATAEANPILPPPDCAKEEQ